MRRPVWLLFALAAAVIVSVPAITSATPPVGEKDNGFSKLDERYLEVYVDCWHALKAECGRNIVDDGVASGEAPSEAQVERSMATMDRWLHPPKPEPVPASSVSETVAAPTPTSSVAPAAAPAASGSYSIPESIVQCESGGSYTASNPSGAYGAYQIMPGTAQAYGCDLSTPAGQDSCAAEIYADVGSSAWSCAG